MKKSLLLIFNLWFSVSVFSKTEVVFAKEKVIIIEPPKLLESFVLPAVYEDDDKSSEED